jgi:hypothetical protein
VSSNSDLGMANHLLSCTRMRRCVHIAITLLVVLALARPFDCFGGAFTRKAAACCAKGKCLPSANADECCKASVPAGNQLSAPNAPEHSAHLAVLAAAAMPVVIAAPSLISFLHETHAPPESPPNSRLNLPLLI